YSQYHVRSGAKLLPAEMQHDLDEIQVAIANDRSERSRALIDRLLARGVKVTTLEIGAIQYEVLDSVSTLSTHEIEQSIDARNAARKAKNFKEADRIRDELLARGIVLKDNADGTTTWEVKR